MAKEMRFRRGIVWLSVAGMLMVHPVQAQQQNIQLSVTLPEAELIWKALRKLPVEEVEQVMAKLRQQVSEQQNKPVEKSEGK